MVGDDQEPRLGPPRHLVQKVAKARHVGIVERRIDLVEHADRGGVGQEHAEDQRQRRQRLFASRQEAECRELLARRLAHDLEPRLQRIVAFDQYQPGLAPAEQSPEQRGEIGVDLFKGGEQAFAPLAVQPRDARAKLLDRFLEVGLFGGKRVVLRPHGGQVVLGAQVDGAERLALAAQAGDLDLQRLGPRDLVWWDLDGRQKLVWREIQIVTDALARRGQPVARGIEPGFRPCPPLACLACHAFGLAFGRGGGAQGGFAHGQRIGGAPASGLGLLQPARKRRLAGCDLGWQSLGRGQVGFGRRTPRGQFLGPFLGRLQTVAPAGQIAHHLLPALRARLGVAPRLVLRRTPGDHRKPCGLDPRPCRLDRGAGLLHRRQVGRRRLGLGQPGTGVGGLVAMPGEGQPCRFQPPRRNRTVGLGPRLCATRLGQPRIGGSPGLARRGLSPRQIGKPCRQRFMRLPGPVCPRLDLDKVVLQGFQPVQLPQPVGRCLRRVFGRCAQAIPSPQVTLAADQPLPRDQCRLQCGAFGPRHQADLRQTPRQHQGRSDMGRQGRCARGQGGRVGIGGQRDPARACGALGFRQPQVIAERGADRRLVTRFDAQPV